MRVPEMTIRAKGQAIILRTATEQDAQMLIDYLKKTCAETCICGIQKNPHSSSAISPQSSDLAQSSSSTARCA